MNKHVMTIIARTGVILVTGLLFSACQTPQGQMKGDDADAAAYLRELQVAPELRIKDMPVPAGFEYVAKKSMIVEYGSTQAGNIEYVGSGDVSELIAFYKREMGNYDWKLVNLIEMESTTMLFDKPRRSAKVTIGPGSGLSRNSTLNIYYAPKE